MISKKRKSVNAEEVAGKYYLLAKATMADRNVSSIYRIRLDGLSTDEFSDAVVKFRRRVDSLVGKDDLEVIVLSGRDLSVENRNELIQLTSKDFLESGSRKLERAKGDANEIYFQLHRVRV